MPSVSWSKLCTLWACVWMPSVLGLLTSRTTIPSFGSWSCSSSLGYRTRSSWTERSGPSAHAPTRRRSTLACSLEDLRTAQKENGGQIGEVSYDDGERWCTLAHVLWFVSEKCHASSTTAVLLTLYYCTAVELACAPGRLTFANNNHKSTSTSSGSSGIGACVWLFTGRSYA